MRRLTSDRHRSGDRRRDGAEPESWRPICVFCASSERIDPQLRRARRRGRHRARAARALAGQRRRQRVVHGRGRAGSPRRRCAHRRRDPARRCSTRGRRPATPTSWSSPTTCAPARARWTGAADAFLRLPGGLGTLEELLEIWVVAHPRHARQADRRARPRRRLRAAARAGRRARRARLRPRRRVRDAVAVGGDGRREALRPRSSAELADARARPPSPRPPTRSSKPRRPHELSGGQAARGGRRPAAGCRGCAPTVSSTSPGRRAPGARGTPARPATR